MHSFRAKFGLCVNSGRNFFSKFCVLYVRITRRENININPSVEQLLKRQLKLSLLAIQCLLNNEFSGLLYRHWDISNIKFNASSETPKMYYHVVQTEYRSANLYLSYA